MNASLALEQTASAHSDKTAYTFLDTSTTYGELNETVTCFAAGLQSLGLKKGDHITLLLGNSPHFIIALYGAMRAGLTVIPVNPVYTPNEISYILQKGDVKAVIMLDLLLPAVENMHESLLSVDHYIVCDSGDERAAGITASSFTIYSKMKTFSGILKSGYALQSPDIDEEDTAVILYTSGTTGKPKGAMLTHKNIYSNARDIADYLSITEKDTVITVLPMFHVFCLTVVLNAPIVSGAEMIILPAFSPKEVFKAAKEKKQLFLRAYRQCIIFYFNFQTLIRLIFHRFAFVFQEVLPCRSLF